MRAASLPIRLRSKHGIANLPICFLLPEYRPRNLKAVQGPRIRNSAQPGDRPQNLRVDQTSILIDRILPHPKPHALDDRQHGRLLPGRLPALELLRVDQLALDAEHGLLHPRARHLLARRGMEAAERPLRHAVRHVDGASVGRFDEVLRDDVDGALARLDQVAQAVLLVVEAAAEADGEDGGVMVDDLCVAERAEVGAAPILAARAQKPNRSRDDARDEELVVESGRSALGVRVDVDVAFLQRGTAVVPAGAVRPAGVNGLAEGPMSGGVPVRTGGLDCSEVSVWVAFDG